MPFKQHMTYFEQKMGNSCWATCICQTAYDSLEDKEKLKTRSVFTETYKDSFGNTSFKASGGEWSLVELAMISFHSIPLL